MIYATRVVIYSAIYSMIFSICVILDIAMYIMIFVFVWILGRTAADATIAKIKKGRKP